MKFIDPKTDFAFKRIFGSKDSDNVLISFINASLKLTGAHEVGSVEIKNPYQERHLPIEKQSIVDIACTDKQGVKYLVEMQVENVEGFANRIIYNAAKCYSGQLDIGGQYPELNDVVLIAVMDFTLFKKHPHYHSIFVMKDQETNYAPFNQLRLCCLELKKFNKTEDALSGMLDKWAYFLKEAPRLDICPEALGERVFEDAFERAQVANLSRDEREVYDAALQEKRDKIGRASFYRNEGEARGRALGRAEGRALGVEETASKMLEEGLEQALICKLTGLNAEDISRIVGKK